MCGIIIIVDFLKSRHHPKQVTVRLFFWIGDGGDFLEVAVSSTQRNATDGVSVF
jgi:hypothetical protein